MVGLLKTRHQPVVVWATVLRVAFLLLLSAGFVHSAEAGVPPQSSSESSAARGPQFAISDFDSDGRPDMASLECGRGGPQNYAISFRLTSGSRQLISLSAPEGGLKLKTGDVNGDSFPDVVVTTLWTDRPVAVLLNDGLGNFTRSEPSAFPGAFAKSENSLTSSNENKADTVAALLSRYSPEPWKEHAFTAPLLSVFGRSQVETRRVGASAVGYSSFGRAPPHLQFIPKRS